MKHALRQLLRTPGFTAVALLTLALGIGANAALFSVINALLLRPLPFPAPEQLVFASEWSEQVPNMSVSYPNFLDFRERTKALTGLGAFRGQSFNFAPTDANPERVAGAMVSHDLFTVLGTRAMRGRLFTADDDRDGAERTVVIRESFWQSHLGGREDAIGSVVRLSGLPYTVIGVLPDEFPIPNAQANLYAPVGLWAKTYEDRDSHPGMYLIGRLRPGVTVAQARDDLRAVAEQLAREYPKTNARQTAELTSLADRAVGQARAPLFTLFGAVGCVLLIACANLAGLLLARGALRGRELAVRAALGARRVVLVRHILGESLVLGAVGGLLGLLVAYWSVDALKAALPAGLPRVDDIHIDPAVLAFTLVTTLLTSLGFGLLPALTLSHVDLRADLATGGRQMTGRGQRMRTGLVVAELALAMVLLSGTFLMLRSLHAMMQEDPGFATERRLTFNWVLPYSLGYETEEKRAQALTAALDAVQATPGVASGAFASILPVSGGGNQTSFSVVGGPEFGPGELPSTEFAQVSPDYFGVMEIPLLRGRSFSAADSADANKVVVIDTTIVDRFFHDQDPLGQHLMINGEPREIVGVVGHIQNYGIGQPTRYQSYVPYSQDAPAFVSFVLRTPAQQAPLLAALRDALRGVDPNLPLFNERWLEDYYDATTALPRFAVILLSLFGGLALLLAVIGLTGLLGYSMARRTREIGIRMALGATWRDIITMVLAGGGRLIAAGLGLGLAGALVLAHVLRSQIYGVPTYDPLTFVAAAVVLAVAGTIAALLPARRAARTDPVIALRAE